MGVHVHRSERTDALLRGLAELLADISGDPFSPEIVAVPTPGIERFITQGLGTILGTSSEGTDGVCANINFPSPAAIATGVISQATGIDPRTDQWLAQRAVWPLLSVIDRSAAERCAASRTMMAVPGPIDAGCRVSNGYVVASPAKALAMHEELGMFLRQDIPLARLPERDTASR